MEEFQIFTACKTAVIDPRIIMGEVEQNADSLELIYLRSAGKAPALHLLLDLTLPAIRGRKAEHILVKADINSIILLNRSRPGVVPLFKKLKQFARKTQSRSGQTKSTTRQCLLIFQLFLVLLRRP